MKFFTQKEHLFVACYLLLLICAAFALSYPLAFRAASNEQLFVGEKSYETLLSSQDINALVHPYEPNKWIAGEQTAVTPFSFSTYLYAILFSIIPQWALPALLSWLLLTLIWLTLNTFTIPLSARFVAVCMFAFSPLFISTQLSLGSASFLFLFLALLVFALRSHWHPLICASIAFLAGLFGVDAILVLALILVFTTQPSGHAPIVKHKHYSIIATIIGLCVWLALSIVTQTSFSALFVPRVINSLFVDFGAQSGQTILLLILALIGAVNIWKKELRWHFVAAIAIVIWSSFFPNTALVTTAVLSYFAGSAFTKIWGSKWAYVSLKRVVLASILLAVIASYFIFSNQLILAPPTTAATDAYDFIAKNTPSDSVVFALPYESSMVSYFSQRKVINTNNPSYGSFIQHQTQTQKILYSKSLSNVLIDLKSLGVTHILIDSRLQSGDLWREDKGGLPLLLRNKRTFTLIYDEDYHIYSINYDAPEKTN